MVEAFTAQLEHEANDLRTEIRVRAFASATLHLIYSDEHHEIIDSLTSRHEIPIPSSATRLVLRALQKQLLKTDGRYPEHFDTETAWLDAYYRLRETPQALEIFKQDLSTRQLQSNISERYKAFKLTLALLGDRLGPTPRILDVGCSRNHGIKKLQLNLPFSPITCAADAPDYPLVTLNSSFNSLLRSPLTLGRSVGADIVPINFGPDGEWARSCSFYPSELLNNKAVEEYDYLEQAEAENISFRVGDFTDGGLADETQEDRFDAVTASTFLYQLSPDKRQTAREYLRKYLSVSGVIIYQDFVSRDSESNDLQFQDDWTVPFSYRTILEFSDEEDYLYEFFHWDNGRCNAWRPGEDIEAALLRH